MFSAPFFDPDGNLAGSVAAVILSTVLRGITGSENYSLISPLAEYISVPLPRDKNLRLMLRAANSVPSPTPYFRKRWSWIPMTRAANGNCTSIIRWRGSIPETRFTARKDF